MIKKNQLKEESLLYSTDIDDDWAHHQVRA